MVHRIRLILIAAAAVMVMGVVSAAPASAAEPEITESSGTAIPNQTPVTAEGKAGEEPTLTATGKEIKCKEVKSVAGETVSAWSLSIVLLFSGCEEPKTKTVCTSTGNKEPAGSIITSFLLLTLYYTNKEKHEVGSYVTSVTKAGEKVSEGTLAEFKCGEVNNKVTGCVPGKVLTAVNTAVTMLEGEALESAEIENRKTSTKEKCETKAFGLKAKQTATKLFSWNLNGALLISIKIKA